MSAAAQTRWSDLRPRVISAIVMLSLGGLDLWFGAMPFLILISALIGAMIWELARMSAPSKPIDAILLGLVAGGIMLGSAFPVWPIALISALFSLIFLVPPRQYRLATTFTALAIMACGYGLFWLRETQGILPIMWLLGVVIVSDISGYFIGRMVGGPKFWPAISPKKTWSGTIAGWVGAAIVGAVFVGFGYGGASLIVLSPLVAFAGQMGDIAESWLKRRAGIKDSSRLIPGHGGVLDRFDAVVGATVAVLLISLFMPLGI